MNVILPLNAPKGKWRVALFASSGESAMTEDRAAVAFHPPIMLLIFVAGGFLEQWILPVPFLPDGLAGPIGIPIVIAAFGLFGWAVQTMRRGGASIPTNTATDTIVAGGPFRFSRNPIYLSMTLLLIGIGCWANAVWFLFWAGLAVIVLTLFVIRPEERYLEEKFGETYLAYKRNVRRWI
jgi:protein-S-isoprenylcysteine O-methyltransferase Ste14